MKKTSSNRIFSLISSGTLVHIMLGSLYAWSIFRLYLTEAFPAFTAAQMSLNFTIATIFYCLGGFLCGLLDNRLSGKRCLQLTAVLVFAGMYGVSFMEQLPNRQALLVLYAAYGVLMGTGNGLGYTITLAAAARQCPARLGIVSGVMLMGYGAGSLIIGVLAQWLESLMGIFVVFRILGIGFGLLILLCSFFLEPVQAEARTIQDKPGLSPKKMLCTLSFWVYFLLNISNSASGLLVINSAANIAVWYGAAATIGLLVSLCNSLSRPVSGYLLDQFGIIRTLLLLVSCRTLASLLLVCGSHTASVILVCIGMFLTGACYGGCVAAGGKVINELYGPRHYTINLSIANFCMLPGAFIGPLLSGILQDHSNGAFHSTFLMMTVINLLALGILWLLNRLLKQENRCCSNAFYDNIPQGGSR